MMPLISLADGLAHARQHRYALGAFNVLDSHFLRALFAAALVVLRVKHSNPILVMVCCGAVSLIAKFIAG